MNILPFAAIGTGLAATAAITAGGLAFIGRRLVMPRPSRQVTVSISDDGSRVTLPASAATLTPGEHGFWFDGGHARVGKITRHDVEAGVVVREIVRVTGSGLSTTTHGQWSGHAFGEAHHVHSSVEEVRIRTADDDAPAWLFRPTESGTDTWGIHVHGLHTSRFSALRTVPVALDLGMTSLVPSYYGDSDNPGEPQRPSYLGQREWADIEAALDFAVANGAKKIVLFGWSMGGAIALLLSERSRHRALLGGIVLVSAATDMRRTIVAAVCAAGLPKPIARLAPYSVSLRPLSLLSGLSQPIDLDALDWSHPGRLQVPTLAIHSGGDADVPAELTRRFVDANPNLASLALFSPVPHQLEWNAHREEFEQTIKSWVRARGILP